MAFYGLGKDANDLALTIIGSIVEDGRRDAFDFPASIGPQLGYIFKIGENQAFLGVKGYGEFNADNRPHGWNTWLTFSIAEAVPTTVAPVKHRVTK